MQHLYDFSVRVDRLILRIKDANIRVYIFFELVFSSLDIFVINKDIGAYGGERAVTQIVCTAVYTVRTRAWAVNNMYMAVYTACVPCTRPRTWPCTLPCLRTRPYTVVYTAMYRVHGCVYSPYIRPVHDRVHGRVYGPYTAVYGHVHGL